MAKQKLFLYIGGPENGKMLPSDYDLQHYEQYNVANKQPKKPYYWTFNRATNRPKQVLLQRMPTAVFLHIDTFTIDG